MRAHARAGWIAAVGAVALLVTACSSGKPEVEPKKVTIASVMGMADPDDFDFNATVDAIEELVADCMTKEGWTYFPQKIPDLHPEFEDDDAAEVARIKREGLGITYYLLGDAAQDGVAGDPWVTYNDKNLAYVAALNDGAKKAYNDSLYGSAEEQAADKTTAVDPATGQEVTIAKSSVGCRGEAADAFYGDNPAHNPVYKQLMQSYWDDLDARTAADPRFIAANAEWSACMKKAGYDYETPAKFTDSTYLEFQGRASDVVGPDAFADPTAGWTDEAIAEFWKTATPESISALYSHPVELTADQRKQIEAIFAEEVAVALANHTCSKDFNATAKEISADVEAKYAVEHEDEFKQLVASLSAGE